MTQGQGRGELSAVKAAELCSAIYQPGSKWGQEWQRGDIRIGGLVVDGVWTLVVRGTVVREIGNWLSDLDSFPHRDAELELVHRGFFLAMASLAGAIDYALQGAPRQVMGHSMGGSLALLYAARCVSRQIPVLRVETFAPARVAFSPWGMGTRVEALLRGLPGHDWAHPSDEVPKLPPLFRSGRQLQALNESECGGFFGLDPLSFHCMAGYEADVKAAGAAEAV